MIATMILAERLYKALRQIVLAQSQGVPPRSNYSSLSTIPRGQQVVVNHARAERKTQALGRQAMRSLRPPPAFPHLVADDAGSDN